MNENFKQERPPNPREKANLISLATFFFTIPTFIEGYKKQFEEKDLYETLSEHKSNKLGNDIEAQWQQEVKNAEKLNKVPSLMKVLIKIFGTDYFLCGIGLFVVEIVFKLIQPYMLGQLILCFSASYNEENFKTKNEAYVYAGGIVVCSFLTFALQYPCMMKQSHIGMKIRISCCALIYRKALKLNKTALGETTVGQLVNLLSNDVNRFDWVTGCTNYLWIGPIQSCIIMYILYTYTGISGIIGIIFLLSFVPLHFILGKLFCKFRLKVAKKTDERVRLMNEIIQGIQVIKMYTWEKKFAKLMSLIRRSEIKSIKGTLNVRGINVSYTSYISRCALLIAILSYIAFGYTINAQQVFVLISYFNISVSVMVTYFSYALGFMSESYVSTKRINNFLLYPEVVINSNENASDEISTNEDYIVAMQNGTAKWLNSSLDNTLFNLNLNINRGSLIAIIGPVGSGKSSLIHAILKELPLLSGYLRVNGRVSYCSQEPWVFSSSVRQNILFGQEMDKLRYETVIDKCVLQRDLNVFPYADRTIIGERGASLSGGQKSRINLARAIYRDADIYLLDDPLSAVDTHVGRTLFDKCIKEYLNGRGKTVILVTHQLQYLKDVDRIILLKNGSIETEGSFTELQNCGLDFTELLKSNTQNVNDELIDHAFIEQLDQSFNSDSNAFAQEEEKEGTSSGSVSNSVYKSYIKYGGSWSALLIPLVMLIISQLFICSYDFFLAYWTNLEQRRSITVNVKEISSNISNSWDLSTETSIYVYIGLTIPMIISTLLFCYTLFNFSLKASKNIHNMMFNSVIKATMRFFITTSCGRILNRFSKDMGAVDERLPFTLIDFLQYGTKIIGVLIMVAIINPWVLIVNLIIITVFYLMRIFYMPTSQSIKRLEGTTRSPVFAHLNTSLQALTTIRAFGTERRLEEEFDNYQDLHSSSWFIYISCSTAFGYYLEFICTIYIFIVTFSFLFLDNEYFGGDVGLAISQSLTLSLMTPWLIRQTAEFENQMTSAERVLEYTQLESEKSWESTPDKKPSTAWPENGEIIFKNVSLRYSPKSSYILKDINITIQALEKVGIVGRTGAGKSSLITALFQMNDTEGTIIIDNVDIKDLGLHDLRSKISIIPQEPIIFSGTLRSNLDPFNEYDDKILWDALENVEFKTALSDEVLGLNMIISEGGSNFSVGERQLLCLARAIIRKNKILILDEATANVDPQTDAIIQRTIKKRFASFTVLTIAHRLNTVMDSDKILVMDAGRIVEFGHPHCLLQNTNSYLFKMVQQTGKEMVDTLLKNARNSYINFDTSKTKL